MCAVVPSVLVTVPRITARRVLHFAVYSGDYPLQRIICPPEPSGDTRGNTGAFFLKKSLPSRVEPMAWSLDDCVGIT